MEAGIERTTLHALWCMLCACAMGLALTSQATAADVRGNGPVQSQSGASRPTLFDSWLPLQQPAASLPTPKPAFSAPTATPSLSQPQYVAPTVSSPPVSTTVRPPATDQLDRPVPVSIPPAEAHSPPHEDASQGIGGMWRMLFGSISNNATDNRVSVGTPSMPQASPRANSPANGKSAPAAGARSNSLAGSLFGQLAGTPQTNQPATVASPIARNTVPTQPGGFEGAVASLASVGSPTTGPAQAKPSAMPTATQTARTTASANAIQPEALKAAIEPQAPIIANGVSKLWQQVATGNVPSQSTSLASTNNRPPVNQSLSAVGQVSFAQNSPRLSAQAANVSNESSNLSTAQSGTVRGNATQSVAASTAAAQPEAIFAPVAKAVNDANIESHVSSGLWRPLAMNQDGTVPRATAIPGRASAPQSPASGQVTASSYPHTHTPEPIPAPLSAEGQASPFWLRPFYLTNTTLADTKALAQQTTSGTNDSSSGDFIGSLQSSSLARQLSMSNGNEPPAVVSDSSGVRYGADQVAYNKAAASGVLTDAALSAFMQDLEPEPADLDAKSGEEAPKDAEADKEGEKKEGALSGAEKLGKEPEDNTLVFLRAETVLLKPGQSQFDIGMTYLITSNQFPILLVDNQSVVGVDEVNFRSRQLVVPMEYRTGLLKRVQGFLGAPVGWANTQLEYNNQEGYFNDGGLGDVYFGLTAQLIDATPDHPYMIGTLSATAPTGSDPFTGVAAFASSAPALGQGFWSIQGQMLFIQEYDPCVVFYGGGVEGFFPHEYIGREFQRGMEYSYLFGIGFAVNERITLSSRFRGSYIDDLEVDGNRILGSNIEPMTLRFAATISKPCKRLVEPFVEFGLTEEAVNSYFGITWTF